MISIRRSTSSIAAAILAVAVLVPAGVAGAAGKGRTGHAKKRSHHVTRVHKSAHSRAQARRPHKAKPKVKATSRTPSRPHAAKPKVKPKLKGKAKAGSTKSKKAHGHGGKRAKKHGRR
jgi:hypothetical protein